MPPGHLDETFFRTLDSSGPRFQNPYSNTSCSVYKFKVSSTRWGDVSHIYWSIIIPDDEYIDPVNVLRLKAFPKMHVDDDDKRGKRAKKGG